MDGARCSAKLLDVRSLSTALGVVSLLVGPVASGQPAWASVGGGAVRDFSVSDRSSDATWLLHSPRAISGSAEWGTTEQMVGVRLRTMSAALTFQGPTCAYCDGSVEALSVLGTYRRAQVIPNTRILQMVELMAGVTAWHSLRGRNGMQIDPIPAVYDLSYGAAIGVGYLLTERLEASAMYEILMARHRLEALATNPRAKSTGEIGMAGLRLVARYHYRP